MSEPVLYGGQAVIEGVMMRGPDRMAIAVRRPDGQVGIRIEKVNSWTKRHFLLRLPIIRGFVALIETLGLGMSALLYSASEAAPEEGQLSKGELTLTTVAGIGFAVLLFIVLPTWAVNLVRSYTGDKALLGNIVEGIIRLGLFLGYLKAISLMKDIERVFQYHGAEHKVINAWEAGDELTVSGARSHSREHKRCGTSFLLYVVVVAMFVHMFLGWPNVWVRILSRLAILPVVAGLSYEIIRWMGRHDNALVNTLSRPGMWLQGLTTREPDDSQLEVSIAAFQAARGYGMP